MELILNGAKLDLKEGVEPTKFMANMPIAVSASEVKQAFLSHGFNLDGVAGAFIKTFTVSPVELEEIKNSLDKIVELGLTRLFNNNLKLKHFKGRFVARVEKCEKMGVPYLNSDNTFASFLDSDEDLEFNLSNRPQIRPQETIVEKTSEVAPTVAIEPVHIAQIADDFNNKVAPVSQSDGLESLSIEGRQVYNDIVQRLNFLVLGNAMDAMLAAVVKNTTAKIVEPIIREEYKWTSIAEMIESVMFDGLDVTPEDNERISELISGAFPDEERKMA